MHVVFIYYFLNYKIIYVVKYIVVMALKNYEFQLTFVFKLFANNKICCTTRHIFFKILKSQKWHLIKYSKKTYQVQNIHENINNIN